MASGARKTSVSPVGGLFTDRQKSEVNGTNRIGQLGGLQLGEMKAINPLTYAAHSTVVRRNCKRT